MNKVKVNLKSPQNPNGVFTRNERSYIDCLQFKKQELDVFFKKDEAFWQQNIENAERSCEQVQSRITNIMKNCQNQLQDALDEA